MAIMAAVASSLVSSMLAPGMSPGQAQQMVDPFAQYRGQYGQQLNQLMTNPASVTTLPGYQAQLAQGTNTLERQLAATGQQQSGQEQIALNTYGQQFQRQAFQDQFNVLSQLSGASTSPAAGGAAGVQQGQYNQAMASQFGGAIGSGISNWVNSPGSSNPNWFSSQLNTWNANAVNAGSTTATNPYGAGNFSG